MNLKFVKKKLKRKFISFFYLIKVGTLKRKLIQMLLRKLSNNEEDFNQIYKEKNIDLVQLKIPKEIILLQSSKKINDKVKFLIRRNKWEGFFSNFNYVLINMHFANVYNFDPIVDMESSSTFYTEKNKVNNSFNAWDYYFQQDVNLDYLKINSKFLYSEPFFSQKFFYEYIIENTSYMHFLFKKYIKIRREILDEVNEFVTKEFGNSNIIGIHWRGTDLKKHYSNGSISKENYADKFYKLVDPILKNKPNSKIFLCTEENRYLENFKERFGNKIINTQCFRSDSDLPPHLMNNRPRDLHRYNLGREVLIDAILLSRTNTIIGLRSNVFNSALIMGNITKERQIIIDGLGI